METRRARRRVNDDDGCLETGFRGLVNSGCTCYVNCVLQVLLNIPSVKEFFLDNERPCTEPCLVCELVEVARQMQNSSRVPFAATRLLKCLRTTAPEFADGGMHDAHDFWLLTVDAFTRHPGGGRLMDRLLKGETLTTLKCQTCGYMSSISESVMDLSLPMQSPRSTSEPSDEASTTSGSSMSPSSIPQKENDSDEANDLPSRKRPRRCGNCATCANPRRKKGCLRNKMLKLTESSTPFDLHSLTELTTIDTRESKRRKALQQCLDESNGIEVITQWSCHRCQEFRNAVKETVMVRSPDLLTIHLKRFEFDTHTFRSKKLDIHIDCPIILDTSVLCPRLPIEKWKYCLVAIIAHKGSLNGGHFWTYVRKRDRWFKLNDASIGVVDFEEVMTAQAYMAFYEKVRQTDEGYLDRPSNQE